MLQILSLRLNGHKAEAQHAAGLCVQVINSRYFNLKHISRVCVCVCSWQNMVDQTTTSAQSREGRLYRGYFTALDRTFQNSLAETTAATPQVILHGHD